VTGAPAVLAAELRAADVFLVADLVAVGPVGLTVSVTVLVFLVGVLLTVAFLLLVVGCVLFVLVLMTPAPR
jgi:hypothetical protein